MAPSLLILRALIFGDKPGREKVKRVAEPRFACHISCTIVHVRTDPPADQSIVICILSVFELTQTSVAPSYLEWGV